MAERVVLHVGLMKSGTTFIQGRLGANRDLLAEQGVLFPGPTWRRHSEAAKDLNGSPTAKAGAWASLREEILAHPGTSVVSMEYLGPMPESRIAVAADDLAGADVQVVITVRDLGRAVPAMWQESVKNRGTWTWPEYLDGIRNGGEAGKKFWRQQGSARIIERWVAAFGSDHVTVVTVPPPGSPSELLWDRFCEVAGVSAAPWLEAPRANESLGTASVALMAQLNAELADLDKLEYKKKVKALAKHVLVNHKEHEDTIGFTVPRWLRKNADRIVARIADSGVRVVGDLADLTPVDVPGSDPSEVPAAQVRDAAVAALVDLLRSGGPVKPPADD
ncbi:hypothetical protein [Nocardioides ferulae]|uniref:hypothetical protein n=1 Tax=Nocardioides ferulae TaxID=2340821 RepID=UPI000F871789|nr:hypothetical protein [Nocardioides ferulae]